MSPSAHKIKSILVGLTVGTAGLLLAGCGGGVPGAASAGSSTTASSIVRGTAPTGPPPVGPPPAHPVGGDDHGSGNGGTYSIVPMDPTRAAYEGATVNKAGQIVFWISHPGDRGGAWQEIGQSTFPTSVDPSLPDATVTGALLPGMPDATFIVHGTFSEDGGVNAVSFTSSDTVRGRWGVIKALPGGDLAGSGQGVAQLRTGLELGLENDIYFANGQLETAECSQTLPMSACGGDQRVLKYWKWNGRVFVLDHAAGLRT